MKKIWIVLLLAAVCAGCSVNASSLERELKTSIDEVLSTPSACLADNHKTLFSYYAEPRLGRKTSTATSNVFLLDGEEIVMNLDISTVINSKYYPEVSNLKQKTGDELVYLSGTYTDCHNESYEYALSVYQLANGKYYVDLQTQTVNFYSYLNYVMIEDAVIQMLKISRTVEINETEVISYYSSKPADEHEREQVNLFTEQISENGRLDELIGVTSSDEFTEEEVEIEDPIQDMPDVWIDEMVTEE